MIFEEEHIFINFPPGSGGNFIAAIMKRICDNNIADLPLNENGSFHMLESGKREGKDSIAFGSNPEQNEKFSTLEERSAYYLNLIKKEYTDSRRIVTWSHDYTNLPLYKKNFPNSKVMSITTFSVKEKLMSIIMHINKVILTSEKDIAISFDLWHKLKTRLMLLIDKKLKKSIDPSIDFYFVFNDRFNKKYSDIIFYYGIISVLEYLAMHDVLDLLNESYIKNNNFMSSWANGNKMVLDTYSDAILPFSHLPDNDIERFIESYSMTLHRDLSIEEKDYLEDAFIFYRNMQDQFILKDPIGYFLSKKQKALEAIKELKLDILAETI